MQTTKYDVDLFQNQSRQLRNPTSATTATATATNHPINANILHRGGGRVLLRGFQHSLLLQHAEALNRLLPCFPPRVHRFVAKFTQDLPLMIRGEGRDDGDDDKYTLRLPENVALKIVKGGHNYSKICSSSKDMARLNAAPCKKVMFKLYLTVPHPVML
ncbi:hypothetical protein glysoja_014925 [Glycine soja]|nr:hypothetical protein glysoja_014925 [Glycine soja]